MLDIQRIRNDTEAVKRGLEKTGAQPSIIDEIVALDSKRRDLQQRGDALRAEMNTASKEIGRSRDPAERAERITGVGELKARLKEHEAQVPEVEKQLRELHLQN